MAHYVVFVTAPSHEAAENIARVLVEERLAACVNIAPGLTSVYRWKGKIETEVEVLMVIKTSIDGYEAMESRVIELHPYDVPEVLALEPSRISESYRRFLDEAYEND